MKSIFDQPDYEDLVRRIQKLDRSSVPLWGKMSVAEMLHHLNLAAASPLGEIQTKGKPNFIMRLFRSVLYNDKAFGKGVPTPRDFKVSGNYDFEKEKAEYLAHLEEIGARGKEGHYQPHVFFGKITAGQWGLHFYKHTDHHLKQFGV